MAYADSCKVDATNKKLAGAAMTRFMKKCETDAKATRDKSAAEKNWRVRPQKPLQKMREKCRPRLIATDQDFHIGPGDMLSGPIASLAPRTLRRTLVRPESPTAETRAKPMSALGHKRTYAVQKGMSALPPRAGMCDAKRDVRFVPVADNRPSRPNMSLATSLFSRLTLCKRTCGSNIAV